MILDEFMAITGLPPKHAIHVLHTGPSKKPIARQRRGTVYDEAVRQALVVLWEASDRICGRRLKPLIPPSGRRAKAARTSPARDIDSPKATCHERCDD